MKSSYVEKKTPLRVNVFLHTLMRYHQYQSNYPDRLGRASNDVFVVLNENRRMTTLLIGSRLGKYEAMHHIALNYAVCFV